MAELSPLLRQCIDDVVKRAPDLMGRVVEAALPVLQDAENKNREVVQRDRLAMAWRGVLQHQVRWQQTFPGLLKKHLYLAISQSGAVPGLAQPSGFAELSLVDDGKVVESLESGRLLQDLMPAVEHELAALDVLMSSAMGQDVIRPEFNPLRPEVFANVLRELLTPSEADPQIRAIWWRYLVKPLGAELKLLYPAMAALLRRAHVREAGYRVRLMANSAPVVRPGAGASPALNAVNDGHDYGDGGSGGSGGGGGGGGSGTNGSSAWGGLGDLPAMPQLGRAQSDIDHQVFHDFLQRGGGRFDAPLAQTYYQAVDEELASIERMAASARVDLAAQQQQHAEYRSYAAVDRPARPVGVGSQLSDEGWGSYAAPHARDRALMQLKKKARQVNQVMGLDVVRTLVNQVAHDPLLLAPVREAVVALEPALLHLSMDNPRFFAEDKHPARRLVEAVAQRSFRYNDEYSSEFGEFFKPVQKAFNALNSAASDDPQVFNSVLGALQKDWDANDRRELETQDDSLQSIRFAEERQTIADQVAWDLSQRPDLDNVPGMILDFLYSDWALVIAHAKLTDKRNEIDPGGFRTTVSGLLWSVKKDVTLRRPAKLMEIVPGIVSTLHAGLDLLGKERQETKPFFDALMRLHNPVLKLRRAHSRREAALSAAAPLQTPSAALDELASMSMEIDETLAPTEAQRKPRKADKPWFGRRELNAAGFEETLPTDYAELSPRPAKAPVTAPIAADVQTADYLEALTSGDSVAPIELPLLDDMDEAEAANEAQRQEALFALDALREGAWVDLYSKRQWLRAQLIWASTKGTLFMFVSSGGRPHSMTKRSCEKLIRDRLLRPVKTGEVVGKAMTALAQAQKKSQQAMPEPLAA